VLLSFALNFNLRRYSEEVQEAVKRIDAARGQKTADRKTVSGLQKASDDLEETRKAGR